jgi:type IV fimbrial biogenesis protein FimT
VNATGWNEAVKATRPGIGDQRGFTLIELLIAIAMFSVITAFAVPSFSQIAATQRVRSVASDLHTALLRARSEAVKRNGEVAIEAIGSGWNSGWRIVDIRSPDSPETIELRQDMPGGTTITVTEDRLVYRESGRLAAAGNLEVTSSAIATIKRCVRTDLAGRPFVETGSCQ